jgi:hypothetical protein
MASKRFDAAVLYCLAQGDTTSLGASGSQDSLGPFMIKTQSPEIADLEAGYSVDGMSAGSANTAGVLYVKTVPFSAAGDYSIQVQGLAAAQDPKGKAEFRTVGKATVKVSEQMASLWSPWIDPLDVHQPVYGGGANDTDYSLMDVANPSGGAALPGCNGWQPVLIRKLPDAGARLPVLIPSEPDWGITLKLQGNEFIVKLDEDISTYYPDEHFLTRWWVNGKLFIPDPKAEGVVRARQLGAADKDVREARFRVEFHPDYLGLKKGDKVAVQLLYCRKWEYLSPAQMENQAALPGQRERDQPLVSLSRLSNRIEFIYSGDPKSIAGP